ncbi:MAG: helix-turn-helix domain-containing protein [Eubacteriales bacterium]|nr:helix-turn-helix domain-containing protein [Eubacteriales bacterium]
MPVIRVDKNKDFTTICNVPLKDKRLSLRAKGLLAMCISFPDDWDYSVNGLAAICKEGRDAIMTILRELEECGYLTREQPRLPSGKMGAIEYVIHECPPQSEFPTTVKPTTGEPITEKPMSVNPTQLITNESIKEEIKDLKNKEIRHKHGQYGNVLLSEEELGKLQSEFPYDYGERIERLSEYMASTGKSYRNHLATIRNWARREKPKQQVYNPGMYEFKEGESL